MGHEAATRQTQPSHATPRWLRWSFRSPKDGLRCPNLVVFRLVLRVQHITTIPPTSPCVIIRPFQLLKISIVFF